MLTWLRSLFRRPDPAADFRANQPRLLAETAEQVHRVRRRRDYLEQGSAEPQPASARWAMRQLREAGKAIVFITHSVDEAITLADRIAVVTNRPGQIREIVTVDFPRPRGRERRKLPEFQAMRDHIWDLLSNPIPTGD